MSDKVGPEIPLHDLLAITSVVVSEAYSKACTCGVTELKDPDWTNWCESCRAHALSLGCLRLVMLHDLPISNYHAAVMKVIKHEAHFNIRETKAQNPELSLVSALTMTLAGRKGDWQRDDNVQYRTYYKPYSSGHGMQEMDCFIEIYHKPSPEGRFVVRVRPRRRSNTLEVTLPNDEIRMVLDDCNVPNSLRSVGDPDDR